MIQATTTFCGAIKVQNILQSTERTNKQSNGTSQASSSSWLGFGPSFLGFHHCCLLRMLWLNACVWWLSLILYGTKTVWPVFKAKLNSSSSFFFSLVFLFCCAHKTRSLWSSSWSPSSSLFILTNGNSVILMVFGCHCCYYYCITHRTQYTMRFKMELHTHSHTHKHRDQKMRLLLTVDFQFGRCVFIEHSFVLRHSGPRLTHSDFGGI